MKETMKKVIAKDLRNELQMIECETLLLWGENDKVTPLRDGKLMNKLIRKGSLITVPKARHFPYLERHRFFMLMLMSFLASDIE